MSLRTGLTYVDEDGKEDTIFITRGAAPPPLGGLKVASYRSPIGKIAAQPAGEEIPLPVGGREQWVTVKSSTKLDPLREVGVWDSKNNRIDLGSLGKATVVSLRALLEEGLFEAEKDILAEALAKDEPNYIEGIRRAGRQTH